MTDHSDELFPEAPPAPEPPRALPPPPRAGRGRTPDGFTSTRDEDWTPGAGADTAAGEVAVRGAAKYGPRPTGAEIERRIEWVTRLLILGYRRPAIMEKARVDTDWDVSRAAMDRYLKAATDRIRGSSKRRTRYHVGRSVEFYDAIATKAVEAGNFTAAIRARRQLDALLKLAERANPDLRRDIGPSEPAPTPTEPDPSETANARDPFGHAMGDVTRADTVARLLALAESRRAAAGSNGHGPPAPVANPAQAP